MTAPNNCNFWPDISNSNSPFDAVYLLPLFVTSISIPCSNNLNSFLIFSISFLENTFIVTASSKLLSWVGKFSKKVLNFSSNVFSWSFKVFSTSSLLTNFIPFVLFTIWLFKPSSKLPGFSFASIIFVIFSCNFNLGLSLQTWVVFASVVVSVEVSPPHIPDRNLSSSSINLLILWNFFSSIFVFLLTLEILSCSFIIFSKYSLAFTYFLDLFCFNLANTCLKSL